MKDDDFNFTSTQHPKQLFDKKIEGMEAIKDYSHAMDKIRDNVSQDILQQEKGCIKAQESALNDVFAEYTEEIVEHTVEKVWKAKEFT